MRFTEGARYLGTVVLLAAVYHLSNRVGLFLQGQYEGLTPLWPSSGIGVALLWLYGLRWWPVIVLGEFTTGLALAQPAAMSATGAAVQLLEAALAQRLLAHLAVDARFTRIRDAVLFALPVCLLPPVASGLLGAGGLLLNGLIPPGGYPTAAFTWWLGDAMGILIVTPLIATWRTWPFRDARLALSWGVIAALLVAAGLLILLASDGRGDYLFFLLLPFMVWSALRAGAAGAAGTGALLAGLVLGFDIERLDDDFLAAVRIAFVGASAYTGHLLAAALAERRAAAAQLRAEQERAWVTLQSIGDGVISTTPSGEVFFMNGVAERLTGWRARDAIGQPIERVLPFDDAAGEHPARECLRSRAARQLGHQGMVRNRRGEQLAIEESITPIVAEDGQVLGTVIVFRDFTAERRLKEQLAQQALHDPVTGLANRRAFDAQLRRLTDSIDRAATHALLYLDLDQFKLVNDACGHETGDRMLAALADRLRVLVPPPHLIARLGGDEFGVLLAACEEHEALALAERLRREILDFRFEAEALVFSLGASIGVTFFDGRDSASDVMSRADIACHMAKEAGRNNIYVFRRDDAAMSAHRMEILRALDLRRLLAAGRFRLYAQRAVPLSPAAHDAPEFREVLLRLDEDGRIVTPDRFLPVAARYGLLPLLDRWVIEQAFRHLAARRNGSLVLGINVAAATLDAPGFAADVLELMRRHDIAPGTVCFEVTENVAIDKLTRAMETMRQLDGVGFRFALDDFGSGVTGFGYLQQLPVRIVKLDGRIVRALPGDASARLIAETLVALAHRRGLVCIAEGVEDEEPLAVLRELGVDYAQGLLLAAPEPLEG